MYFGINCNPLTLYEIADKFGLTHERTRQLKNSIILKLQKQYSNKIKKLL